MDRSRTIYHGRERDYSLGNSEVRTLTDLAKFRVVPTSESMISAQPYATRLSAGGVADEWVTQMLRQGDAQVFKKYSQMKLQMMREALEKMNRQPSEMPAQGTSGLCAAMLQ